MVNRASSSSSFLRLIISPGQAVELSSAENDKLFHKITIFIRAMFEPSNVIL